MADLKVNSARVYHCDPMWNWVPMSMPDYHLWTITAGRGRLETPGESVKLVRGKSLLFRPGSSCKAMNDPGKPLSVISVHFNCHDGDLAGIQFENDVKDPSFFEKLLLRIVEGWSLGDCDGAGFWLASAIKELSPEKLRNGPSGENERLLDALCGEIEGDPSHDWSVLKLASRMNVCLDHFIRVFRAYKGVAPNKFIIETRIDYAKCLLSASSHPVERVAELCGYRSLSFMTRQFKEKTGMTPSAFRRLSGGR